MVCTNHETRGTVNFELSIVNKTDVQMYTFKKSYVYVINLKSDIFHSVYQLVLAMTNMSHYQVSCGLHDIMNPSDKATDVSTEFQ